MNVYKVVKVGKDGALRSVFSLAKVRYLGGRWSKPRVKGSKLFCWPSLKSALVFLEMSSSGTWPRKDLKLFKCEAKNPVRSSMPISAVVDLKSIRWYWRHPAVEMQPSDYFLGEVKNPYVLADAVKLRKEIRVRMTRGGRLIGIGAS
jgi:hypothetical protein